MRAISVSSLLHKNEGHTIHFRHSIAAEEQQDILALAQRQRLEFEQTMSALRARGFLPQTEFSTPPARLPPVMSPASAQSKHVAASGISGMSAKLGIKGGKSQGKGGEIEAGESEKSCKTGLMVSGKGGKAEAATAGLKGGKTHVAGSGGKAGGKAKAAGGTEGSENGGKGGGEVALHLV